ncbi:V-type ATP synthase subunit A [Fluoribacter dumoffii]|uniref:V-type ATP synthase subunit A n=1 Tax=Fluoribacter dumoffii TaxID=463 RepID=UPI00224453AE|nr:V-type ATP synthase subunit A [Fluoribacter dumoffii]MCW8416825.1 V-type ATP synthase subunit A [Fluoribacter dumoffii]MCW8455335.1 V-type ATP synthase subunit A [Fluoribacter dumoffii]MCW8460587.1 V-type ATP synthase subunit A [Fluoribacter dumoffii]MCW8484068.1 V-type ATP synthase subunit A [Fluoribacter dumoffii]
MKDNMPQSATTDAIVIAIQEGIVEIRQKGTKPLIKNEIIYICPQTQQGADPQRIMAEILHVKGDIAIAQVFEETSGIAVGDRVEQSGEQLSVTLGPGLLGMIYDGLQNPLINFANEYGFFLPRGMREQPIDSEKKWVFSALVRAGDSLNGGDVLGVVQEGRFTHKIMVPFDMGHHIQVEWIQQGTFTANTPIAKLVDSENKVREVSMLQKWPVRFSLAQSLMKNGLAARLYPSEPMITTLRLVDTFFPIARGGTACIPGPFGAGKTVLQNLIARYADVDIVIIVACGERAGEVVETITEFPKLVDPKMGGTLMDRTIIVCNTSSMPVAAREASIYTGITLGEYYRQMGFNVLLIADSTSRWAQAMRETSGRMEEIPGEEGFPAYLDSSIRGLYERAGIIQSGAKTKGSLTIVGTVSPAGGNFEEPVTQSTLNSVKTFLGLSYDRAYKRFYPAVDPLISWSRYFEQLKPWFESNLGPCWINKVMDVMQMLHQGQEIYNMMQVTGEEGIAMRDYIIYQKSLMFDMTYLQQDAYDPIDVSVPMNRQKEFFDLLLDIITKEFAFSEKEEARNFFVKLTGMLKNLNYSPLNSDSYNNYYTNIIQWTKL